MLSGWVGLVVHVGIPVDKVSRERVLVVFVVVVGVRARWRGGRGLGVGWGGVFRGLVGTLGGFCAGWGSRWGWSLGCFVVGR